MDIRTQGNLQAASVNRPQARPAQTETLVSSTLKTDTGTITRGDSVSISAPVQNPYGSEYEGFVTVKPQKWSSNRTPADGMVARGDHLDGLLLNQGFTQEEINGGLREQVAKMNGLKNPNLIYPEKGYILPTKLSAEEIGERFGDRLVSHEETPNAVTEDSGSVTGTNTREISQYDTPGATVSSDIISAPSGISGQDVSQAPAAFGKEGQSPVAQAGIETPYIQDSSVTQAPVTFGENGNSAASIKTGSIDNSVVTQAPAGFGDGSNVMAGIQADSVTNSQINQSALAEGQGVTAMTALEAPLVQNSVVEQAPKVVGSDSLAAAGVSSEVIDSSIIRQAPTALGDGSTAAAGVEAEVLVNSSIQQAATAKGEGVTAMTSVDAPIIQSSAIDQTPAVVGDGATASAKINTSEMDDAIVTQAPSGLGDGAQALADIEAEVVSNTTISQKPVAVGENSVASANLAADAVVSTTLDQAPEATGEGAGATSRLETGLVADSAVSQAPKVRGDGGEAIADVEAGTVTNSVIAQGPEVTGDDATAGATLDAELLSDTVVMQDVKATGERVNAVGVTEAERTGGATVIDKNVAAAGTDANAGTETVVGTNTGVLETGDVAVADGNGAEVAQVAVVENNEGSASVTLDGTSSGDGDAINQGVLVDGDGTKEVLVSATGDGDTEVTQVVEGQGQTNAPPTEGKAVVVSDGAAFPKQEISGFNDVTQVQVGAEGSVMGTDATNAAYVGEADKFVTINHEGKDGTVQLNAKSKEKVFFGDGMRKGTNGALRDAASGNDITGKIEAPNVRVLGETANSLNLKTVGTDGDDRHEVIGPDGAVVVSELAGGTDVSSIQAKGASSSLITKTDGELRLAGAKGGAAEVVVDAGEAKLTGDFRTSRENDRVFLQLGAGGHDLKMNGGDGEDLLVIDLKGDAPQPKIVTREGGWIRSEQGITPDGWTAENGTIVAKDYEGVLIRRDGKIVVSHGTIPGDVASFEDTAAAVAQRYQNAQ